MTAEGIALVPWADDDRAVLEAANTAELTRFLGGVESDADLAARHAEYLSYSGSGLGAMFRVVCDGDTAGYAGWWDEMLDGERVCEVGCSIRPAWQGRGVASAALRLVTQHAAGAGHVRAVGFAHADHAVSHALCRAVGFERVGDGTMGAGPDAMPVAVFALDLSPHPTATASG